MHDKDAPWKSFLVIVDGSPKNDEGHKTEQPKDEHVSPKLSDILLSFGENSHFKTYWKSKAMCLLCRRTVLQTLRARQWWLRALCLPHPSVSSGS